MLNLSLFIIYCILLIYTCITVYSKIFKCIFSSFSKYHLKTYDKILIFIFCAIFLYFLTQDKFKYNNSLIFYKYSLLLFVYSYIPIAWGIFFSTLIYKKAVNQEVAINVFIQIISSLLLIYYGFKDNHLSIYSIFILIVLSICVGYIIYKNQLKKIEKKNN